MANAQIPLGLWGVDMFEVVGFVFLCVLNSFFSVICLGWFLVGGFELGSIFSSKEPVEIISCLACCALNIYFWTLIASNSPLSIVVN